MGVKLDTSKRMTRKKLGFPEAEKIRLLVFRYEIVFGEQLRRIDDIIEGPHKWIVSYFNCEREWWDNDTFEIEVEEVKKIK